MTDKPTPASQSAQRHRRSERHLQPPRVTRAPMETVTTPTRAEKTQKSHSKGGRGEILGAVLVAVLVFVTVLCAFRYADSALKAREEQERIQAERDAHEALLERHEPRYVTYIQRWSDEYGIDPAFVKAVIYRESHYDARAISGAGARGLMQLMPYTVTWMEQKAGLSGYTDDSLFDPEINIRLGTRYLNYLSGLFDGDPILVVCAYHAGAGNVRSWLENHSSDGKRLTLQEIPMNDTKTYAERVMQSYAIYLEME